MHTLVVYDSAYGNTEKIARAIGAALGSPEAVVTLRVSEVKPEQLLGLRRLIVGSPTQRFRPTIAINGFLKAVPADALRGVEVAAFDTRLTVAEIEATPALAFFVRIFGYAAKPIADALKRKGGQLLLPPEGFYVQGMEGPLVAGELERSTIWAAQILARR